MKKNMQVLALVLVLAMIPQFAFAGSYTDDMMKTEKRGITNIATGLLEIPMGIRDAGKKGTPGLNYVEGLLRGTGKALVRTGSGVWDVPAGLIPGLQAGMPPKPATLF